MSQEIGCVVFNYNHSLNVFRKGRDTLVLPALFYSLSKIEKSRGPIFSIMIKTRALPILPHIHTEKLYLPNSGYISLPNL